ncbi:formylglycine-generating enzyme required for sulfatase activity [Haloferula luteola]|uniref:Formylglycine-generating enzyme required for sulfatase activity n=1 Tax=Haloferula luteola TaxID=595692 RepID=A0A840V0K9_9BACT|nr:formylglycine-generating enzyme family protein [Haloferula luteola]MBB5351525.1 formylglycine-generating enzyme required for sulfatase activity [Haloferula luteola]
MTPRIWQPDDPTPGWLQAEKDSDLTIHLPLEENLVVPLHFRRIPAGGFRMGQRGGPHDEEPVHLVRIPQPFYLGTFAITQVQYRAMAMACLADLSAIEHNLGIDPSEYKGDLHPVENVSWEDADAIARWLTHSGLLPAGWHSALPPEAHWEYACRAGTDTEYWSGDGAAALKEVGWFSDNNTGKSHPVGELPANSRGLHDMHGNVMEWCADVWDAKAYRKRPDGWVAREGDEADAGDDATYLNEVERKKGDRDRVLRGGTWVSTAGMCRSAYRDRLMPVYRLWCIGFRLCVFPGSDDPAAGGPRAAESAAAAVEPRDEVQQAQAGDEATAVNLSHATLPPRSGGEIF